MLDDRFTKLRDFLLEINPDDHGLPEVCAATHAAAQIEIARHLDLISRTLADILDTLPRA